MNVGIVLRALKFAAHYTTDGGTNFGPLALKGAGIFEENDWGISKHQTYSQPLFYILPPLRGPPSFRQGGQALFTVGCIMAELSCLPKKTIPQSFWQKDSSLYTREPDTVGASLCPTAYFSF